MDFSRYATRFRAARKDAGLSREGAAKIIGKSERALQAVETGENGPTLATLEKMADAYGVLPGDLLPHTSIPDDVQEIEKLVKDLDPEARRVLLNQAAAFIETQALMLRRMTPVLSFGDEGRGTIEAPKTYTAHTSKTDRAVLPLEASAGKRKRKRIQGGPVRGSSEDQDGASSEDEQA